MKLKIMTYNIAAGRTYFEYAETKKAPVDIRKSADFIKNENPVVCGLNEVDKLTERSGGVDEVAFYEKYLGMGKNAITAAEWCTLVDAYKDLTKEEYEV